MRTDTRVAQDEALLRRWPDLPLTKTFKRVLPVYEALCARQDPASEDAATRLAYRCLCRWIRGALAGDAPPRGRPCNPEQERVRAAVMGLREAYRHDWLQRLASLLAMLMHFALEARPQPLLVNRRRPGRSFPTYPTSPAVARLAAEAMLGPLLERDVPVTCRSVAQAERYAESALAFRILDPSMESGQLLLEIAQALLRRVHVRHARQSREGARLAHALLEKLCRDCLWGVDRNELAPHAFELLISLLGAEHGLPALRPRHLLTADALELLSAGRLSVFDGVVNNPPWGEELAAPERASLRCRFSSLQHRADTYVPFSELAVRCLRPDGAFALILPSQALTARNAAGLRELLIAETYLEQVVLLPRAAFGDATVRGVVLTGRRPSASSVAPACRATLYPLVKRMAATGPPRSHEISWAAFRRLGAPSWSPLLSGAVVGERSGATVPLADLAIVASGVQVYGLGRGIPRQTPEVLRRRPYSLPRRAAGTRPAVRGRDVQPFRVLTPQEHVRFGVWLACVGRHDTYRRQTRIFVRELCRRDGRLSAAVAKDGYVPLHGVLAVVPTGVDERVLVGILNSGKTAEYVRTHAASFSKVDFQRITVGELRRLPVPLAALDAATRGKLGLTPASARELALRSELIALVEELSDTSESEPVHGDRLERLDSLVAALFAGCSDATA